MGTNSTSSISSSTTYSNPWQEPVNFNAIDRKDPLLGMLANPVPGQSNVVKEFYDSEQPRVKTLGESFCSGVVAVAQAVWSVVKAILTFPCSLCQCLSGSTSSNASYQPVRQNQSIEMMVVDSAEETEKEEEANEQAYNNLGANIESLKTELSLSRNSVLTEKQKLDIGFYFNVLIAKASNERDCMPPNSSGYDRLKHEVNIITTRKETLLKALNEPGVTGNTGVGVVNMLQTTHGDLKKLLTELKSAN